MQDPVIAKVSERKIEEWARGFGTEVLLRKLWEEGAGVRIEADKASQPPR